MSELDWFKQILYKFTRAVETNDGLALATLFTPDGMYEDAFYGEFKGREAIAYMLRERFWGHAKEFKWCMSNPIFDGQQGFATYVFSYCSTLPEAKGKSVMFDGIAKFVFEGQLIASYSEVFNTGMALAQLDFAPERIKKHLLKKAKQLRASVE